MGESDGPEGEGGTSEACSIVGGRNRAERGIEIRWNNSKMEDKAI